MSAGDLEHSGAGWSGDKHDVLVCDDVGERLLASRFAHDEAGIRSLCSTLVRLRVELVGIERPDGLLVERLLDAGLRVLALHPNQVVAARSRFRASDGKSDRFDAFVVCELTRTDHHRFRVLEPDSAETKALRALTRARKDLVQSREALTNQLRDTLLVFWAGPVGLFADLDSPISLALLERYPSPTDAARLGVLRLDAFLKSQHYSGGKSAAQLLAKLRRRPQSCPGEAHMPGAARDRAKPGHIAEGARRSDQGARAPDRRRAAQAPARTRSATIAASSPSGPA